MDPSQYTWSACAFLSVLIQCWIRFFFSLLSSIIFFSQLEVACFILVLLSQTCLMTYRWSEDFDDSIRKVSGGPQAWGWHRLDDDDGGNNDNNLFYVTSPGPLHSEMHNQPLKHRLLRLMRQMQILMFLMLCAMRDKSKNVKSNWDAAMLLALCCCSEGWSVECKGSAETEIKTQTWEPN